MADRLQCLFVGTLAPTYVEEFTDDKTNLGLEGTTFVPLESGVVKANRAYLPIRLEKGVKAVNIVLERGTGLQDVGESSGESPWYSISGMKVSRPAARGVYIQNGRKVVVAR